MWPPSRVAGVTARSRLTTEPARKSPSVERCKVSREPSAANAGITLDPATREGLLLDLINGRRTRAAALRAVVEDAGFQRQEFNRAFVLMQYFGYLQRDPDSAPDSNFDGYNFWLGKLNQFNGNFVQAEMVKAFLNSTEYRARFGQP